MNLISVFLLSQIAKSLEVSASQKEDSGWSRRLDDGIERISNMLSEATTGAKGSPSVNSLIEQAKGLKLIYLALSSSSSLLLNLTA